MLMVFLFICLLAAVAYKDATTMEIPDNYSIAILVLGMVSIVAMPQIPLMERLIGMFSVSVPLLLITAAIPGAFGGGDIKLMGASGLFLGWRLSLIAVFMAVLFGGIYGMYLLITGKKGRKDHFAFGPFLCVGMVISLFWGMDLLHWYLELCGL